MRHRNTLASERKRAKALGFEATSMNARARNPFMLLADGSCLLWLAGGLIARVTTANHFGQDLYLICWKSSNLNQSDATLSATLTTADGIGEYTASYYRKVMANVIKATAEAKGIPERAVFIDHINHMRGDCRVENLRPADAEQNRLNRSKIKVEKAFYTEEDVKENLATGIWVPLRVKETV